MKIKAAAVLLFVFVCCPVVLCALSKSEAASNEDWGPSYYYGAEPDVHENDLAADAGRYPDYLPSEFRRKPAQETDLAQSQKMLVDEPPVSSDFMPYDEAQEKYSGQDILSQPQPQPQTQQQPVVPDAPVPAEPAPEFQDQDGFIPYEYAREIYSQ